MDENLMLSFKEQQRNRQEQMQLERKAADEKGEAVFGRLGPASLLYALIYTVCLYKNTDGIAVVVWVLATLGFVYAVFGIFGTVPKKDSIVVAAVMCLLGISTFLTGNRWIISMNYCAVFLLLVVLLLHNFGSDGEWDMGKYLAEIAVAVCGAVRFFTRPFLDGSAYYRNKERKMRGTAQYVAVGAAVAVPCLCLLGTLLMSADMVFADMVQNMFVKVRIPNHIAGILFMVVFGFFSSYCGVRFVEKHAVEITVADQKTGEPLIALTAALPVAALYLVFCTVQIAYLFVGNMQLPEGVTYGNYARSGFFQLLIVCIINLALVLAVKKHFKEHRLLNIVLLVISGCTFLMTASSAWRMILYIRAYRLTFLRVGVLVALAVITLLLAGVVRMIVRPQFPLLKYGIAVVTAAYLLFSFSHVDYFIASYNLTHAVGDPASAPQLDYGYIFSLSTDAAPAIADYIERTGDVSSWYMDYCSIHSDEMSDRPVRNFNLSHYIAGVRLHYE